MSRGVAERLGVRSLSFRPTAFPSPPHSAAFTFLDDGAPAAAPASAQGLFASIFAAAAPPTRAVPFDPADMRALDGLAGGLKSSGVLNK